MVTLEVSQIIVVHARSLLIHCLSRQRIVLKSIQNMQLTSHHNHHLHTTKFPHSLYTSAREKNKRTFDFSYSMPNPPIPRSQSAPRISGTPQSPPHSDVPSRRTSRSEFSPRIWPKKFGDFIARKTGSSSSSKKSNLTEESLKEFNRLNEILEEKKYFQQSPYYKGLTDSSLVINRQRHSLPSPDRESHAGSLFSSSTKTSFVYRMQEWGSSWFVSKHKEEKICVSQSQTSSSKSQSSRDSLAPTPYLSSLPSSSSRRATKEKIARERTTKTAKELGSERKEVRSSKNSSDIAIDILNKRKPLRERVFEAPSPPPQTPRNSGLQMSVPRPRPPPTQTSAQTYSPQQQTNVPLQPLETSATSLIEKVVQEREINKYIWADKYRPFALKDFLCNRSKALELQDLVRWPFQFSLFCLPPFQFPFLKSTSTC